MAFFKTGVRRTILLLIFCSSLISFVLFSLYNPMHHSTVVIDGDEKQQLIHASSRRQFQPDNIGRNVAASEVGVKFKILDRNVSSIRTENSSSLPLMNVTLNHNIHIFYYPWYKNKQLDGKYTHWNHEVIPDWHKHTTSRKRQYVPPNDIGANFYPELGPYSSRDPKVIEAHMQQMRFMGTGVVCVSWYPPTHVKASETQVDDLMFAIFDMAARYGLKVTFHIEPYDNRSGETLLEVSRFIIDKYGSHAAFYRTSVGGRSLPVYYVYDSYQIPAKSWAKALKPGGAYSIRNTKYDGIFLGLLVEKSHFNHLTDSGFDGFYTYFAAEGFTYGSTWIHWRSIANEAENRDLIFVPSIGPGYLDTRVRPWNSRNARPRLNGRYYRKAFDSALSVHPRFLSITSYNEWHEGTQVEPAVPKVYQGFKYIDYSPNSPEYYLNLTRQYVVEYTKNMTATFHLRKHDGF